MKNIILAAFVCGAATLTSCSYDTYPSHPGGHGPARPGWGHQPPGRPGHNQGPQSSSAYQRGYNDGARDKRTNRRFDPSRGQGTVNAPFRDSYRSGYTAGYRATGGHQGGGQWGNGPGRPGDHRPGSGRPGDGRPGSWNNR